jgi:hypothetical protein
MYTYRIRYQGTVLKWRNKNAFLFVFQGECIRADVFMYQSELTIEFDLQFLYTTHLNLAIYIRLFSTPRFSATRYLILFALYYKYDGNCRNDFCMEDVAHAAHAQQVQQDLNLMHENIANQQNHHHWHQAQ